MTTLLAFIGAIALLVVFHELGHYFVARYCGVKILRFSIGFGKVIYRKRFFDAGTEWVISAVPMGGYVKMLDTREDEVAPEDLKYAFDHQPVLQRMAIVAAGPLANFLLAIVLYWVLFVYGVPGLKPVLGDVPPGSPAANAQMQANETILSINGEIIPSWQELRWTLLESALSSFDTSGGSGQGSGVSSGREVKIEARSAQGEQVFHLLDISSLEAKDLEGEFLDKLGLHPYRPTIPPVVGKIADNSVAQRAGLQEGDRILRADGVMIQHWMELVEVVRKHAGQVVRLDIQRGEMNLSITVMPEAVTESGPKNSGQDTRRTVGKIGVAPKLDHASWQALLTEVRYGPVEAFTRSLRKTWETSVISLKMMGKMVLGEISMKNLSGPITIADYAGQSAEMGVAAYLGFLALISISLGVLNLLPIPLLDGGHLLYYTVELAKGSPVSEQAWETGQKIGIALLSMLMVFAIYNDISRLISG